MAVSNTPSTGRTLNLIDEDARRPAAPSVLAAAIGGAVTLFGLGITFFNPGGPGPGPVVLTVGAVLLLVGIRGLRRHNRLIRYRLTRPFSPSLLLFAIGAAVVLTAGSLLVAWVLDIKAVGMLSVIGPLIIPVYMGLRTALIMTRVGIGANGVNLPWSDVARVDVTHTGEEQAEVVVIRRDPNTPPTHAPIQASKLDLAGFAEAASRFVPPTTAVVVNGRPLTPTNRARQT